jgi:hypothetical protein
LGVRRGDCEGEWVGGDDVGHRPVNRGSRLGSVWASRDEVDSVVLLEQGVGDLHVVLDIRVVECDGVDGRGG